MNILGIISQITGPVTSLIDSLHTSDAEKGAIRNELVKIQNEMSARLLEYESKLMEAKKSIILAETQGQSWLQRNWRPVLMLVIVAIVANNYLLVPYLALFGVPAVTLELPESLWGLMTLGVGGYIGGRTVEKIAPQITEILRKKE